MQEYKGILKSAVDRTLDGVGTFLSSVCLPASQEFGLMLQDKVRTWRLNNIIHVLEKTEGKLMFHDEKLQLQANPKVASSTIDAFSKIDNATLGFA